MKRVSNPSQPKTEVDSGKHLVARSYQINATCCFWNSCVACHLHANARGWNWHDAITSHWKAHCALSANTAPKAAHVCLMKSQFAKITLKLTALKWHSHYWMRMNALSLVGCFVVAVGWGRRIAWHLAMPAPPGAQHLAEKEHKWHEGKRWKICKCEIRTTWIRKHAHDTTWQPTVPAPVPPFQSAMPM